MKSNHLIPDLDTYNPLDDIVLDDLKLIRRLCRETEDWIDEYISEREAWKRAGVDGNINKSEY